MVEVTKIMVTSFKRSHAGTATLSAPNPAAGHCQPTLCQRLLDTHGQVWVSLLWGHCAFLLGPGAYKFLSVPVSPEQYEKTKRTLKEELPRSVGAHYATGEEWRTNSRRNEGMEPKQKRHPVVDGTGDGSRV